MAENVVDKLEEADSHMTWLADGAVKLYMEESGAGSEKPITVMSAIKHTVKRSPEYPALCYKKDGKWMPVTYKEYYNQIKQAARGFIKLGLEPYRGVGIIGFNSPEWFISNLAAIFAGGLATGIYTTNSPEACQYVAHSASCNIVVVDNDVQLQKILKVKAELPHLKAIIQFDGKLKSGQYPNVYTWEEMMKLGHAENDDELKKELRARIRNQAPNKCCSLIYTSGTTGNPKGAMISHDNIIWTTRSVVRVIRPKFNAEVVVTYLPLSHIAGQLIDLYAPVVAGATVYFAQPDALKGSLSQTLREARPTTFLGVPRVWEKMQEAMVAAGKSVGGMKKKIAVWAKSVGLQANTAVMNGKQKPLMFPVAERLVFDKVRAALGLDRCRLCLSGAAPISRDTLNFFFGLNIPILEVYGMSESSGPHSFSLPNCFYIGSVGKEFPGARTLISNPDADGNGEICMGGRHVFMGYLNMEELTKEVLDEDGWLHSGDIGRKDKNGFLYVTGRIKELIITAGGENIPPVLIEDKVRGALPCVSNCMLVGDQKEFLTMLITLKTLVDPDTLEPKDRLAPETIEWCRSVGSQATHVSEILCNQDEAVLKGIQEGIDRVNKQATSRAQCVQKWSLLPRDFSVPGGELGPTLKLKRSVVSSMYSHTIESLYAELES